MAYVDSNSSRDQVRAALADNASWLAEQSLAKAQAYAVAATVWLDCWAFDESLTGPSKMRFDELNRGIAQRLAKAEAFIRTQQASTSSTGTGGVVSLSVEDFRR